MSEEKAFEWQRKLDIAGLAKTLLSQESKNLQADGYRFLSVLKGSEDATPHIPSDTEATHYEWLPVQNKWNDICLYFLRKK